MKNTERFNIPSRHSVRNAGDAIRASELGQEVSHETLENAYKTLFIWRDCHSYVLHSFQAVIRSKIKSGKFKNALVAQRLKRMPSIVKKLVRFDTMKADRMYDIVGVRVILGSIADVRRFDELIKSMKSQHKLVLPEKDYILHPKADGYRSLHLVFRYGNQKHEELNDLKVELQIRTQLQHSWATAVETLGVLKEASFKSGEGDENIKRFFKLVGALFSVYETKILPEDFKGRALDDIRKEILDIDSRLSLVKSLQGVAATASYIEEQSNGRFSGYHVLELDSASKKVRLIPFKADQLEQAESYYRAREEDTRNEQAVSVVLISAGNIKAIKKAYPNYFLYTRTFINNYRKVLNMCNF